MSIAILSLLTGISISAVAIYYSVLGLASIFSGAYVPIIVMGSILEISKLVSAWWLKANWSRAPFLLKSYMLIAVIVLMLITSMGIFGFLSKAHSDQAIPLGNVVSQIGQIDDRIKIQDDIIATAKASLTQMDTQVNERISKSTNGIGVDKSALIRRQQEPERKKLQSEISTAQTEILKLKDQKAPLSAKLREVEAEVGPIKYIAKLLYGDNPDSNLLEKAVVWVIIIIVFVFDPLAVLLLLASQLSFQWAKLEKTNSLKQELPVQPEIIPPPVVAPTPAPIFKPPSVAEPENIILTHEPNVIPDYANNIVDDVSVNVVSEELVNDTSVVNVEEPISESTNESIFDDDEINKETNNDVKLAMSKWKAENPDNSLKQQRTLLKQGLISQLPWLIKDNEADEAAVEAAKWAQEQIDKNQSVKKKLKNG